MSAGLLNRVHHRYIRVSNAFKSAWTFHQFIQGVRKAFSDLTAVDYPADFQTLYSSLKQVSGMLSETTAAEADAQLDAIEEELTPLIRNLATADDDISPGRLRQFFQRVKSYDDGILTHLVKFYLFSRGKGGWSLDRLDKADFLTTKLAEEYHEERNAFMLRDPTFVREAAEGFWAVLGQPATNGGVEAVCEELRALGEEFRAVASIDDLHHRNLISIYRERKHLLGDEFFQPGVLRTILEVNLTLKNQIQRLYQQEEQSIIAEYQQVFDLEREAVVDSVLGEELSEFRTAVDRFEHQIEGANVRLDELATLRQKVRRLVPKLRRQPGGAGREALASPSDLEDLLDRGADELLERPPPSEGGETVAEELALIVAALDDVNLNADPRQVALRPEVFELGIDPREVVAYRRLFGSSPCDRELEEFVLRAAAVRYRIERQVDGLKSILDDSAVTRRAPEYALARETVRLADAHLKQFEHWLEMAVLAGERDEARALQVLKVRLMRGYSGLWLMVHKG